MTVHDVILPELLVVCLPNFSDGFPEELRVSEGAFISKLNYPEAPYIGDL